MKTDERDEEHGIDDCPREHSKLVPGNESVGTNQDVDHAAHSEHTARFICIARSLGHGKSLTENDRWKKNKNENYHQNRKISNTISFTSTVNLTVFERKGSNAFRSVLEEERVLQCMCQHFACVMNDEQ